MYLSFAGDMAMKKALYFLPLIFMNIALAIGAEALGNMEVQIAVTGSDAKAVTTGNPVEEFIPAKAAIPAQNSFRGITVSIRTKRSIYEPGSIFEIVGTISTDREHTMYNAYWDLKKPVPGRLFVYDEAGNQILEFYDPRHHRGSSTGANKSACRKYKPGQTQQIFLRQYLLFDRSMDCPLPPGRYKVQLALNGLLLWEPQQYVAPEKVPEGLDQQMVAYSNVVDIEISGKPAFQPKTLTQWIEALKDEDPYMRCLAAFTLGKLRDERALPALIEALKDEKSSVRRNAALALGELRDQTAIDPLIEALKKEPWEFSYRPGSVREGIGLALLEIGKVHVDPFIKRLEKGYGEVRITIIGVLAELKTKRVVEPIIPLLKDYSKGVRNAAAYALGKINDERAVEPLIAALKDKDQWVRIGAASSLGMIGDKRAVEPLISLLNDQRAGSAAASALGEIKDKRAVEPLIKCLNHKSSWTRDCSAEALGKIKDARAVEPLIATLKVTKPLYYQRKQPKVTDERAVRDLRAILRNERVKNRHHVAWALVQIGQPAIDPLTGALQSDDKWLSGAAAEILKKIPASSATEPSTPMQSRQGKLEKQLAWLASEADLVVVAENPWQYDRLYARQVLKGSKVSFSNIQEIDGIEKPPTDKNKQWILFLRIEQDHNLLLSPITPSGWFAPYSAELAQRIVAAIPQPETWGETRDGLRMGLRLRKSHFDVGEDIPVEICIQNVSKKAVTLYQHRYNNREYDYYPFTRFVVEFSDGRRLELYKPTLYMADSDSPSPRTLSPGETYIHTVRPNKWTDWYEPAPKPGEKAEIFTLGTFKITCTYSVERNPSMVPEPAHPKNAWSGKLTTSAIKFKIVPAEDTPTDTQPATKSVLRETIEDFQIDGRRRKVSWTLRVVTMEDYESKWFLRRPDQEKEKHIASNITTLSEVHDIKASPDGRYLAVLSVGEGHPVLEVVDLPLFLKQRKYKVLRTINAYPGAVGINRWDKDRLIIDSDALLTHIGENGRVHHSLAEMPLQNYVLSIESGKVEALSQDAKKPIEFFSRQLFVKYAGERDNAAMALVALKAKSAIPDLKKALAAETNPAVRAGMQKAVDELGKLPTARPTTQPVETDIGKKDFRIELHDKDAIKPGLLPIGPYPMNEYPGAKRIYVKATKGQIPRGHYQMVGRMGGHYSRDDEIEVTEYKRQGNRITAHIRYIRAKPQASYKKVVYLLADIPQNLPPGSYNVVITLAEYLREGDKIIFAPKTAIRAFQQLTCTFDVPALTSPLPASVLLSDYK